MIEMIEHSDLAAPFMGRSYEEMVAALNPDIYYPLQLCSGCGRAHVDFEDLKKCPFCTGTGMEYMQVFRLDNSRNEKYQMNMKNIPSAPGKYFHDWIIPGKDGWKWTGPHTARRGEEWVKLIKDVQ